MSAAQLAHGRLEDLRLVRDGLGRHAIERDVGREVVAVVAVDAVLADRLPLLGRVRLREPLGPSLPHAATSADAKISPTGVTQRPM